MATTKVSALAETTSPQSNDELLINQSGVSKKVKITNLPAGTPGTGSISTAMLADDAVTTDKLANSINSAITANTAKTSNATHSGEVTGATALTIADNIVDEANLKVSNTPTNGYVLTAQSGNTGGLTWAQDSATDSTKLPLAGGTMTGDLNFGDNIDANFGAGPDLKIYHDGSNSYIEEIGTGNLVLKSNGANIEMVHGAEVMLRAQSNDAVKLYFNNNEKFETTNTGINVAGNITVTGTVDGVDIQTLNTTASAALPKAGGTMTGDLILGDNVQIEIGSAAGGDLRISHDGSDSIINEAGTGNLLLMSEGSGVYIQKGSSETMAQFVTDGAVNLYHNNAKKIETTANGVTVTGGAVGTMTTDNDGSFAMSASNNFKCTPAGNFALTFTAIVAQSGNILFINSGGHTISAHANTKVDANLLATISTAGTYLLSYFSDGTNVYMTNSAVYA